MLTNLANSRVVFNTYGPAEVDYSGPKSKKNPVWDFTQTVSDELKPATEASSQLEQNPWGDFYFLERNFCGWKWRWIHKVKKKKNYNVVLVGLSNL